MSKTVLITGASSGFGLLVAKKLHDRGYNVIGTSRNPEKFQNRVPFKLVQLDLNDEHSIQSLVKEINQVDVLINNAGYMVKGIAEETPIEVGRQQFETNFWGTVSITNALLPQFRKQKSGQIITVSSIVGLIGPPNLSFYSASKHAVEGYFKSLRFELNQFNIKVSNVQPVWFKTNIGNSPVTATLKITDYNGYRENLNATTQKGIDEAEEPDAVINKIIELIETKEPKFSNPVGKMTGMILFLQNYLPRIFESSLLNSVKKIQ